MQFAFYGRYWGVFWMGFGFSCTLGVLCVGVNLVWWVFVVAGFGCGFVCWHFLAFSFGCFDFVGFGLRGFAFCCSMRRFCFECVFV